MARKPNVAEVMQKDYCRECGKVIQLLPTDNDRYSANRWHHVDLLGDDDPTVSFYCEGQNGNFQKRALPRSFCWESMNRGSWHSEYCGRPVKDHDRFMCGIHANFARKAEQQQQQWESDYEMSSYIAKQMDIVCEKFKEEYGLEVEFDRNFHNPKIIVDPTKLWELLWSMEEHFE